MDTQPILDLDALAPQTFPVVIKGTTYHVMTGDGLPLAASVDAARLAATPQKDQAEASMAFLDRWCGIPRAALDTLSIAQLSALFLRIFPPAPGAPATSDPRTAQGVSGGVLGATPCKLP